MLSKIKSEIMAPATRSMSHATINSSSSNNNNLETNASTATNSDNEEETVTEIIDVNTNDTNNNNNNNIDNNQQSKKSQDELLDIVEVSRKRRLSKDSADSLTGFIRWSFSHMDVSVQRLAESYEALKSREAREAEERERGDEPEDGEDCDDDDEDQDNLAIDEDAEDQEDWDAAAQGGHQQRPRDGRALRQNGKLASGSQQNSATNLVLNNKHQAPAQNHNSTPNLGALLTATDLVSRASKRSRAQVYPSESRLSSAATPPSNKRPSSYLGSVVDRIHHQQQRRQSGQQYIQPPAKNLDSEEMAGDLSTTSASTGLSHQLQQFLQQQQLQQQQTTIEELVSSVGGIDDTGSQLALAAAIHRALVDSAGNNKNNSTSNQLAAGDSKSTASSTGSSSSAVTGSSGGGGHHGQFLASQNAAAMAAAAAGANHLHLVESLNRQRRVYNTRAALHGLSHSPANHQLSNTTNLTTSQQPQHNHLSLSQHQQRHSNATAAAAAAISLNHRMQQQRHAQAAAALSALASAGSQHNSSNGHHNHHQFSLGNLTGNLGSLGALQVGPAGVSLGGAAGVAGSPMVEFKCDTCPSSFDDRHRLMQHQSIHLELKKDWFTETPVDEVMKIFNRRRGEFLCNVCNLRFEATLDYDQHNHQVHGPRPYCCQFCGNGTRTFKCWRQYLNHLYDHRYIFSCTIDDCDFTVNRRDSLRFHIFRFHLNCQLPQNQTPQHHHLQDSQLRSSGNLLNSHPHLGHSLGLLTDVNGNSNNNNKWLASMDDDNLDGDDGNDTENEMNVAD